ncbi:chromate efflux transporter [Roseococcus thiosulfatophilus]|uniref:chromate efflux transporter n=1 Tax=Roseococcus thiosulfatophilus TaxID=35813 RepID=UPI001A8D4D41|nr:chromate efflux transporter [Roseococcus thiosulfatophilus]
MPDTHLPPEAPQLPSFGEALRVWARIGLLSFGGPASQIALMQREVVDQRRWVSDARFLHALNFCMLLPGPEAMQLATYLGWLMHGVKGGVAAGLLFILPGACVILALSFIYAWAGEVPLVAGLFFGLKCAVLVVVLEALLKVARRALHGAVPWAVAAAAFTALFVFGVPFPVVVLLAAGVGAALPQAFAAGGHGGGRGVAHSALDAALAADPGRIGMMAAAARRAGLVCLAFWVWPVALLWVQGGVFADIAGFFSVMAVVTFGGAYAVLAYVAQQAVENYAWLTASDMLVGLGLAETTPGPLILVLQFVGFLAGFQAGGALWAVLGAALTLYVTFLPCFAWIFLGAPYVERLHDQPRLKGALAGVTAAVVGVIANLALWFALRVIFARMEPGPFALSLPDPASVQPLALVLVVVSGVALFLLKLGLVPTLAVSAGLGLVLSLVVGV